MNYLRLIALICLTLSCVFLCQPLLPQAVRDRRVDFCLHAMPPDTEILSVVSAPNILFDQSVIQCPDLETMMQLLTEACFREINELRQKDVLLAVSCSLSYRRAAERELNYPSAHFLFLKQQPNKETSIRKSLFENSSGLFFVQNRAVYEFSNHRFFCLANPGLIICANDKHLIQEILHRLDAWWLNRQALPGDLPEWSYVNQNSPYWGLRHFLPGGSADFGPGTTGLTYEISDNFHPVIVTCLSAEKEAVAVVPRFVHYRDRWADEHFEVEKIKGAVRLKATDYRCAYLLAFSLLERLDPVYIGRSSR
jgi:hypothetical protein